MSQISPPIRILLICVIALCGAYMLVLRPKSETLPPADTPAVATPASAPGKARALAQGAVNATNGQMAQEAGNAGAPSGTATASGSSATAAKAAPATAALPGLEPLAVKPEQLASLPPRAREAVQGRHVMALLFWHDSSSDDRAVRAALRKVDRWNGDVYVRAVHISRIGRWGAVTRGADVQQSPTVVVVDRNLKATAIVGYADTETIDQAVVDAMVNSGGLFTDAYLRAVDSLCGSYNDRLFDVADPTTAAQVQPYVNQVDAGYASFTTRFKSIATPRTWKGFRAGTVKDLAAYHALLADWSGFLGAHPSNARLVKSLVKFAPREAAIGKRFDRRVERRHLLSCASN